VGRVGRTGPYVPTGTTPLAGPPPWSLEHLGQSVFVTATPAPGHATWQAQPLPASCRTRPGGDLPPIGRGLPVARGRGSTPSAPPSASRCSSLSCSFCSTRRAIRGSVDGRRELRDRDRRAGGACCRLVGAAATHLPIPTLPRLAKLNFVALDTAAAAVVRRPRPRIAQKELRAARRREALDEPIGHLASAGTVRTGRLVTGRPILSG
jgi:hypothetical protein